MSRLRIRKTSVLYSASLLILSAIGLQLLGFFYRIVLSRLVGSEGMGLYQMVMSAYMLLQGITVTGLAVAVQRLTAEYKATGNRLAMRTVANRARLIFVLLIGMVAAVFIPASGWVADSVFGGRGVHSALLLMLPCLLLTGFENIGKAAFQGMGKVVPPILSELCEQMIRILAVASLLILVPYEDPAVAAALIIGGMIVSEVFSSSFLSIWLGRVHGRIREGVPPDQLGKKIAAIALPLMTAGLLSNLMASCNTLLMPRQLVRFGMENAEAIATFGVVTGMLQPMVMLPSAFLFPLTVVLVPRLAGGTAVGNAGDIRRKAAKAIHLIALVAFPSSALLITLGPVIAGVMFGQALGGAPGDLFSTANLFVLTVGGCALFYQVICGSILHGIGRQKRAAAAVVITGVFELAFTWLAVPRFGVRGLLFEFLISSALGCALNLSAAIREIRLTVRLRNWFLSPFLASILCGMVSRLGYDFCRARGMSGLPALLCALITAGGCYIAALRFLGLRPLTYLRGLIER